MVQGGFDALDQAREGNLTLKRYKVEPLPALAMTSGRGEGSAHQAGRVAAGVCPQLRTEARTVANWEQGVSKPNAQAAILMKLVERHPNLLEEIATL